MGAKLYINEQLIRRYANELAEGTGASTRIVEKSTFHQALFVKVALEALGLLKTCRPYRWRSDTFRDPVFALEEMVATKVILPTSGLENSIGLKRLAVWISEPKQLRKPKNEYDWHGSFLYLIESEWVDGDDLYWSGCSALQAVLNIAAGTQLNKPYQGPGFEPFGRGSDEHPIQKLSAVGGVVSAPRKIKSMYVTRYFTDGEQRAAVRGHRRRMNDVLAYPFWIEESSSIGGVKLPSSIV